MKSINNQNGFSLTELLVASVIGMISFYIISSGLFTMKKISADSVTKSVYDKRVLQIIENIRETIALQQIDFSSSTALLDADKLPMAWSDEVTAPAQACTDCPGRYGYIIQPLEGMPGLYIVKIRFTHKKWPEPYNDYTFTVGVR